MEDLGARAGGSTDLGRILTLRLGGWLDSVVSILNPISSPDRVSSCRSLVMTVPAVKLCA
ncbi:hypothetical protein EMCG_06904 [[Emmonsia] crescens]|uniref:Uncharacterized protein n=1 Tax=[Emmonsia] crescens TaxID=73230 RepID=A0A0G2I9Z6_9EURO|nr:hypothetical protein EMCG_06904 [Emmonsia crescens UAMH 3008]